MLARAGALQTPRSFQGALRSSSASCGLRPAREVRLGAGRENSRDDDRCVGPTRRRSSATVIVVACGERVTETPSSVALGACRARLACIRRRLRQPAPAALPALAWV